MINENNKLNQDLFSKEAWRLRINGFLSQILMAMMFSICTTDFLTSFHRFVINPKDVSSANQTTAGSEVEPGLGESEFFYSALMATFNGTAIISAFLVGILVKCVPYWYHYIFFTVTLVFGSVLYATAYRGLTLLFSMAIIGLYLGAESTLGSNYAIKLSEKYVEVLKKRGDDVDCEKRRVKIRNYLYTAHTFGHGVGFIIGTGIGVLFSHLSIEQYRSVAWFNVACGLSLLVVFTLLFRGESKSDCSRNAKLGITARKSSERKDTPGALQIFVAVSFLLLNYVETLKWAYFEVLLNPVLSDSFGISLKVSSYFYLGLAIPRLLGPVGVAIFQRLKFSSQSIRIIGFLLSITGYALLTDWQAIPYDPCTEYSPFHHPEQFQSNNTDLASNSTDLVYSKLKLDPEIIMEFSNGRTVDWTSQLGIAYTCKESFFCKSKFIFDPFNVEKLKEVKLLSCSLLTINDLSVEPEFCVKFVPDHGSQGIVFVQSFTVSVLPNNIYTRASNSCMNALDGQCHWIPFSTVTGKKCEDCPPICRGKHQTLSLAQIVIGLSLLIFSSSFEWISLVAMVSNQFPNNRRMLEITLGAMGAVIYISLSTGPLIADALYEVAQKRTFLLSILLGSLNIPFLIEVIVLYRHLGPSGSFKPPPETLYKQLKESHSQ